MGMSASQGRMLLLTARKSDLEFRAQQISQRRLILAQQLETISTDYEEATSNRQMKISLYSAGKTDGPTAYKNLTYGLLVSGTVRSGENSCIRANSSAGTSADDGFYCVANYRLVSPEGYIVVSDESEIPTTSTTTSSTPATVIKDAGSTYSPFCNNLYRTNTTTVNKEGASNVTETKYYFCNPQGALANKVNLKDGSKFKSYVIPEGAVTGSEAQTPHGILACSNPDGTTSYYDQAGTAITDTSRIAAIDACISAVNSGNSPSADTNQNYAQYQDVQAKDVEIISDVGKIPSSKIVTTTEDASFLSKYETTSIGKLYTVGDVKYLVDTSLKGNGSEPNYLQDCLRYGKYLIQEGKIDADSGSNEIKWKGVSWDTNSHIRDEFYTDDDNKAKAKYDRLQSQIQTQDKKLELELDNIETQRKAVETEKDSVQKVIDDNVQDTFKMFSA